MLQCTSCLPSNHAPSLRVAEHVRKEFPESKVIVMDLLPVHEDIVEFVNVGVSGFIIRMPRSTIW